MTQEEVVGRVIDALERLQVAYMVTGSFASNLHGVPRMTQDAGLVVDLDDRGIAPLVRDLEAEFYVSEDAAQEAVRLRRLFNAIHLATGFKSTSSSRRIARSATPSWRGGQAGSWRGARRGLPARRTPS